MRSTSIKGENIYNNNYFMERKIELKSVADNDRIIINM